MGLLSWARGLVDRISLAPVDPAGPAGAFARTVHAALGYEPVEVLVDPADARELLARALRPTAATHPLNYPALARVEAERPAGLAAGLKLLAQAIAHQHGPERAQGALDLELLVGTAIPVPGPDRVPTVEAVHEAPAGFAEVVYAYPGDAGTHRLCYYRDGASGWRLDLVRELARAGAMQAALGGVQEGPCPGDAAAFEV